MAYFLFAAPLRRTPFTVCLTGSAFDADAGGTLSGWAAAGSAMLPIMETRVSVKRVRIGKLLEPSKVERTPGWHTGDLSTGGAQVGAGAHGQPMAAIG